MTRTRRNMAKYMEPFATDCVRFVPEARDCSENTKLPDVTSQTQQTKLSKMNVALKARIWDTKMDGAP